MKKPSVGDEELQGKGKPIDFNQIKLPKDDEEILDGETFQSEARAILQAILNKQIAEEADNSQNCETFYQELKECPLNLPPLHAMDNPIAINQIIDHQARDLPLQRKIMSDPDNYQHQGMQGLEVICKMEQESDRSVWKIAMPESLVPDLLKWYHLVLGHCGNQRLCDTVKARFFALNLQLSLIHI